MDLGAVGNIRQSIAVEVGRAVAISYPLVTIAKMSYAEIQILGRTIRSQTAPSTENTPALKDAFELLFAVEVLDRLWQFRDDALNWIKAIDSEADRRRSLVIKCKDNSLVELQLEQERKKMNNQGLWLSAYRHEQRRIGNLLNEHRSTGPSFGGGVFAIWTTIETASFCSRCRYEAMADAADSEQKATTMIAKISELGTKCLIELERREKQRLWTKAQLESAEAKNPIRKLIRAEILASMREYPNQSDRSRAYNIGKKLKRDGHAVNEETIRKRIGAVRHSIRTS